MTGRLRVLVVPQWYPRPDDPVQGTFVREHAFVAARHHDLAVVVDDTQGAVLGPRVEFQQDGPLGRWRQEGGAPSLGPADALAAAWRLDRIVAVARPQLLHAHVFSAGLPTILVGRRRGIPVIVTEHHSDFLEGLLSAREAAIARFVFRHAARVTAVSPGLARALRRLAPRARVEVVPNPVDLETFFPAPVQREKGLLLAVGTLARQKGYDDLLRAVAQLRGSHDVALQVIGDGPERPALEALAARLLPAGAVRFEGAGAKQQVAAAMRRCTGFVAPSVVETFGIVAAEALACGAPVLMTDCGGIADVVREAGGMVIAPGDPALLAEGMARLLETAHAFDGRAAVAAVAARFAPEIVGRQWDALYRAVATG